jgi:hypothetical protein
MQKDWTHDFPHCALTLRTEPTESLVGTLSTLILYFDTEYNKFIFFEME